MILSVAKDGTGDYATIQAAVDAAPSGGRAPVIIHVGPGTYREKVHITKDHLRLVGAGADATTLVFGDYAKQKLPNGTEKNTFLSYTLIITGNHVELEHITVQNDAGPGELVGQAVAVYAAGDCGVFRNCRMIANQDTLFCGPTMQKVADHALPYVLPVQSASVGDAGYTGNRQYFEDCFIQGDVDFIFGPYRCWFERCTLVCNDKGSNELNGYYTAANTPKDQPYGFVFHNCTLTGDGCAPETVYLGRPWRAYARTLFLDCHMDACVKSAGWEDWAEKPVTWRYGEYGTTGPRADTAARHKNATLLSPAEAQSVTLYQVIGGADRWNPAQPEKTLYVAGDSTASDYPEELYPRAGWGQALPALLQRTAVINAAVSGRSSRSYIAEGRLERLADCLRKGDLLFIQFGHNDEKDDPDRATDAHTALPRFLRRFVEAAREKGALPVLLTPIARRRFANGTLTDTHGEYPAAIRALAAVEEAPLLDAERATFAAVAALGEDASKAWFLHLPAGHRNYPDGIADDTHLCFDGAYEVAGLVLRLAREAGLALE